MSQKLIAALDVGTTSVRCHLYDQNAELKGQAHDKLNIIYPQPGYVEISPDELYDQVVKVIKGALEDARVNAVDLQCIGLSIQRSSFLTWDSISGKPFHNIITWQDTRANKIVEQWNSSIYLKGFKAIASALYMITRQAKFLCGKVLKFSNPQVIVRLAWVLRNIPELKEASTQGRAMYGTLDSWILYKLRQRTDGGLEEHVSDYSNCCCTAFFDPFTLKYAHWLLNLVGIKELALPTPITNSYSLGCISRHIFGHEIKIAACIADQSASALGMACVKTGDIKLTLGTGAFLNINCGKKCYASHHGLYPIISWKLGDDIAYSIEGASNDNGNVVEWAVRVGLIEDVNQSAEIALSVPDCDGVFFVPAFSGLGAPFNDLSASSGFIGIKPSTQKSHMVRALLESLVFRMALLIECVKNETDIRLSVIKVDGGVSRNNFICQFLADLTGLVVDRANDADMTARGAAFLAGLNEGIWSFDNLYEFAAIDKSFVPNPEHTKEYQRRLIKWKKATERYQAWYTF